MVKFTVDPTFTARIVEPIAEGWTAALHFPADLVSEINSLGIKRLIVQIDNITVNRAPISDGQGGRWIMVSKDLMKSLGKGVGAMVTVTIAPDPNPDAVELPEELEAVIEQDEEFARFFNAQTPGKKRGYVIYVSGAKTVDTRIKRSLEIAYKAKHGLLYSQQMEKKRKA